MSDPNEIPLGPEPTPPPPNMIPPSAAATAPYGAAPTTAVPLYAGPEPTPDARTMGMLSHVLGFTLLGPLLVYLLKKDEHPFIADQSREALNFSLCCLILYVAFGIISSFVCFGVLLSFALFVVQIVLGIVGGLKARDGFAYRYPLTFRFIK